ncbi:hypothetical protein ACRE_049600 [Hapsidospora chrysogenum ATCC 11550]|uniref:Uncharacterized protein n=1 Tax=Hapsidospora chrysogenum (strain ATCC 11550 / CBS 779.69 / DSM 880 / IAM 14645 / JCM 23072 / IMI 49137) TaxID=857340 RepID=A0A086T4M8_HAPC1|nr:hypothetical protein ACRE_049600 [Hapsidospora chrysogenum ATCC 11550]
MAQQQKHPVPFLYRLVLLYIEPLCALNGAYLLLRSPSHFLNAVSPNHPLTSNTTTSATTISHESRTLLPQLGGPSSADADAGLASVRILTDMLGIMQLVMAFNLAVVLRVASSSGRRLRRNRRRQREDGDGEGEEEEEEEEEDDDDDTPRRLWRYMCAGMLLSDALHILVSVREHGGWEQSFAGHRVAQWRVHDWLNFGIMWGMAAVRVCVVLGVGMGGWKGKAPAAAKGISRSRAGPGKKGRKWS